MIVTLKDFPPSPPPSYQRQNRLMLPFYQSQMQSFPIPLQYSPHNTRLFTTDIFVIDWTRTFDKSLYRKRRLILLTVGVSIIVFSFLIYLGGLAGNSSFNTMYLTKIEIPEETYKLRVELGDTMSNTNAFTIYPTNYCSQTHPTELQPAGGSYNCFNSTATYAFDIFREFPTKKTRVSANFAPVFNNYISFSTYLLGLVIMNSLVFISLLVAALVQTVWSMFLSLVLLTSVSAVSFKHMTLPMSILASLRQISSQCLDASLNITGSGPAFQAVFCLLMASVGTAVVVIIWIFVSEDLRLDRVDEIYNPANGCHADAVYNNLANIV